MKTWQSKNTLEFKLAALLKTVIWRKSWVDWPLACSAPHVRRFTAFQPMRVTSVQQKKITWNSWTAGPAKFCIDCVLQISLFAKKWVLHICWRLRIWSLELWLALFYHFQWNFDIATTDLVARRDAFLTVMKVCKPMGSIKKCSLFYAYVSVVIRDDIVHFFVFKHVPSQLKTILW